MVVIIQRRNIIVPLSKIHCGPKNGNHHQESYRNEIGGDGGNRGIGPVAVSIIIKHGCVRKSSDYGGTSQ